jgi:hypothetical protein
MGKTYQAFVDAEIGEKVEMTHEEWELHCLGDLGSEYDFKCKCSSCGESNSLECMDIRPELGFKAFCTFCAGIR